VGELADRIGMVRSHVSNILNLKRGFGWETHDKILNHLCLSVEMQEMVKDSMR
jgi:hypothetical protein